MTTPSGNHLAKAVDNSDLMLLNDGSFTHIGYTGQRNSAVNISLVSPELGLEATWETGSDPLQSDHLPIHLVLGNVDPDPVEVDTSPAYQCHRADWELFQNLLNANCREKDPSCQNADQYLENIRNMILQAADESIPKRSPRARGPCGHCSVWWNTMCKAATSAKRKALRAFKKDKSETNRTVLKEATQHCQSVVDTAQKEHWERFVTQEVTDPSDSPKVWKKVKAFRKRLVPPDKNLLVDGRSTSNSMEKAEALADTFAKVSQTRHLSAEMAELRRNAETDLWAPCPDNSTPHNAALGLDELSKAIQNLGNSHQATGNDPISYQMISRFTEPMNFVLLKFYNFCWERGEVPLAWKKAIVVPIPKDGKPRNLPTSYRPIALTPLLG